MRQKRKIQLVDPRLQLKLCAVFLCISAVCLLVLFSLVELALSEAAVLYQNDTLGLITYLQHQLWHYLVISVCILVPLTLSIGILMTFKVCGPLYRLQLYFREIAEGGEPGLLQFRATDELQHLPPIINAALEQSRARSFGAGGVTAPRDDELAGDGSSSLSGSESATEEHASSPTDEPVRG